MSRLPFLREPGSPSRPRRVAWVVAAVAACAALQAHDEALAASTTLGVFAHVSARTRVETTTAPALLVVTAEDVQRGWVDVNEAVVLTVKSNTQRGPALIVFTGGDLVRQGVLTGFSDAVSFGPGQATIQLPPQKPSEQVRYSLNVRLQLAADAKPGEYAFPLRFLSADGVTVSSAVH